MSRVIEFNKEQVMERAMHVFWSKGFEGTSMNDLVEATGLLKGSIYNTFGSKEKLFTLCLEAYGEISRSRHYKGGDPKDYLKKFFTRFINDGVKKDFTRGCFIMNSCQEFSYNNQILLKQSKRLFSQSEENFQNIAKKLAGSSQLEEEIERIKVSLVTAAFSIREISKFKKDRKFLESIANNALREFDIKL